MSIVTKGYGARSKIVTQGYAGGGARYREVVDLISLAAKTVNLESLAWHTESRLNLILLSLISGMASHLRRSRKI